MRDLQYDVIYEMKAADRRRCCLGRAAARSRAQQMTARVSRQCASAPRGSNFSVDIGTESARGIIHFEEKERSSVSGPRPGECRQTAYLSNLCPSR